MAKAKHLTFRAVLIGLAVLYALIIAGGLLAFRSYLQRYERNHPAGAMDAYFQALQSGETEKILKDSDFPFDAMNTQADYLQYLKEKYHGGEGQWQYAARDSADGRYVYDVYESDQKYGTLTLEKIPEGGFRVFSDWSYLPEMRLISPVEPYANGISLDICRSSEAETMTEFDGVSGVTPMLTAYRIQTLLTPTVTLADGGAPVLTTLEDGSVQVTPTVSESDAEKLNRFAEQVARTYACYISNDAALSELQALMESGTPFSREVRAYDNYWYNQHKSVEFKNMQTSPPMSWGADSFTVDVSFDFVVSRTYDSHTYPTSYHITCRRAGDSFRVVNITPL